MDDLVRAYFNGVHNCEVIEENFEYLGKRRYRVVNEGVDVKGIIKMSNETAQKAGDPKADLTHSQVAEMQKEQRKKIRQMGTLNREEVDYIINVLISENYVNSYNSAYIMIESMSEQWIEHILDEKFVKAMDYKRRGPDHRTHFPYTRPENLGQNRNNPNFQYLPKFSRKRLKQNDKKRDPYYSGNRKRKEERRQGVGGFRE